jgi:hypothetical protein
VGDPVSEVHEGGQEPVDEDQPVLRAGTDRPLPRPGCKPGPVPFMPQRTKLSHEFSNHVGRQAHDSPVAGDRCTRRVPHHTTMVDGQELDASPPTVHELVNEPKSVAPEILSDSGSPLRSMIRPVVSQGSP